MTPISPRQTNIVQTALDAFRASPAEEQ